EMQHARRVVHRVMGTPQQQIGVIHRQPFTEPESARDDWRPVVDALVLYRPDAHEIPSVEELMRRLSERRPDLPGEARAWRAQCDGRRMLQRAVRAVLKEKVVLWPR